MAILIDGSEAGDCLVEKVLQALSEIQHQDPAVLLELHWLVENPSYQMSSLSQTELQKWDCLQQAPNFLPFPVRNILKNALRAESDIRVVVQNPRA